MSIIIIITIIIITRSSDRKTTTQACTLFCEQVWPSGKGQAGKQKDLGSIRFGSLFSSKMVVYGHCLVALPTQLMKH